MRLLKLEILETFHVDITEVQGEIKESKIKLLDVYRIQGGKTELCYSCLHGVFEVFYRPEILNYLSNAMSPSW